MGGRAREGGSRAKPGNQLVLYIYELSEELKKCNIGCNLNGHLINHIMYADDLVLISQ